MTLFKPKSKRNITKHLNFRVSAQFFLQTAQIEYLGLTMNEHLDWDLQRNSIVGLDFWQKKGILQSTY